MQDKKRKLLGEIKKIKNFLAYLDSRVNVKKRLITGNNHGGRIIKRT